jgi:prolyl-tRNA editing enzyme YbaK/EbsC (Cys-tRNA(Pro) deacylase)
MKADEKLDQFGIEYEEVIQDEPTKSCDDAAKERGLDTDQIVKSLIVESGGEKFHVLLPGDRTLSEKKFGGEYRMVPPEEAEEITGFEPGTVHPFSTGLKHVVDERIFERDVLSHTVGEKRRGLIVESGSFRRALEEAGFEAEVHDIAVSNDEDFREVQREDITEEDSKFIVNNGYRKNFLNLVEAYDSSRVLNLLKAFEREALSFRKKEAEEVLDRAESQTHMQKLVEKLAETGELPEEEDFNLEEKIDKVLDENPGAVQDYRDGQSSALNFLIGQLMQETNGKADAGETRERLVEELE